MSDVRTIANAAEVRMEGRRMSEGNGQGIPVVGGLPVQSQPCPWSWQIHAVGRQDGTGERVFLLRFMLPTGPLDLWAPSSFIRELGEKLIAQAAGLHIASDIKPPSSP